MGNTYAHLKMSSSSSNIFEIKFYPIYIYIYIYIYVYIQKQDRVWGKISKTHPCPSPFRIKESSCETKSGLSGVGLFYHPYKLYLILKYKLNLKEI